MVGRKPGSPKTGGRKKGTKNKKSQDVQNMLDEIGCNPIEGMAIIAQRALENGDDVLAGNMYKELAQYVAPKRKAVEHSGSIDGDHKHDHDHKFEIVFVDPPKRD